MGILLTQKGGFLIGNIAKLLGFIMNGIFELLNKIGIESIGWSIIIFTIVAYTLMLPMTIKQQKSTRLLKVMNPELQAIQKKYANKKDQTSMLKMQEETKLVYEKYGSSPTSGCLGSIIQLPILFALWPVIQNIPAYVRGVKQAYMPLVEKIMATDGFQKIMEGIGKGKGININPSTYSYAKPNTIVDVLYKFQDSTWETLADKFPDLSELIASTKENVHQMNYFFGVNIAERPSNMIKTGSIFLIVVAIAIPFLAGFTQWLSVKIMNAASNNSDKNDNDNSVEQSMNTMMKVMPLMSVFLCFTMPVGLGIYWVVSAVVRTIQQVVINKRLDKKPIEELVKENMEKAAKKRAKKKEVEASKVSSMAQVNARKIEEPKRKMSSNKEFNSYKENAKPGSLASKANMVSDFNNKKK